MALNRLLIVLKLLQYSMLLPFKYDLKNNKFRYSNFFFYYSSFISVFIIISSCFCGYKFFEYNLIIKRLFNTIDSIFLAMLWIGNMFAGIFITRDKFLRLHQILNIVNNIWKLHRYVQINDEQFQRFLFSETLINIVVYPILIYFVNGLFFGSFYAADAYILAYCILVTTYTTWVRMSLFPVLLIFKYFENVLNHFNGIINTFLLQENNTKNIADIISKYSLIYSEIVKIIKFLSNFQGFQVISYLIALYVGTIWMWYRIIDKAFIGITHYESTTTVYQNHIVYLFLICNVMIIGRTNGKLFRSIGFLLDEMNRAKMSVNNLCFNKLNCSDRHTVCQ